MEDIAPELLKKIQLDFDEAIKKSEILKKLAEKIESGTATYIEANDYAIEVGNILAKVYGENITSDVLPDGKMYYNIANRIIPPTMQKNYEVISKVSMQIQESLNEAAGIGINAVKPELNTDKIDGIVNKISNADNYDDVALVLDDPIITFSQSIVDDSIKVNSEFHGKAGLSPKIIRRLAGGYCEWCGKLAGTYPYPDVPRDVYRRHQRCRCTVDYYPRNAKSTQNVWSKKWKDAESDDELEKRKTVGINKRHNIISNKGIDVTDEYEHNKYPGQGTISYDPNYNVSNHKEEVSIAQWIHKNFGGDIKLLNESQVDGVRTSDYLWNDKFWELKSTTTEKSANSAIRKGLTQIASNPGGIILNYSNDVELQKVVDVIEKRIDVSKESDISLDIMIVIKDKLEVALRY